MIPDNITRGEFVLTGPDPDPRSTDDSPEHRRRVFMVEGGGKLVVWGRDNQNANISKILTLTFPATVLADWIPPKPWAEKFGHKYWVEEHQLLQVL